MSEPNPIPTFRSNKDRAVYLLVEYKWPLLAVMIAGGIWAAFFLDRVPTPPASWLHFSLSWGLLAFPAFIFCMRVAKYLHSRNWVSVGIVDGGGEDGLPVSGSQNVPPETWASRTETGASALEVRDDPKSNHDYLVQKFEYYEDIGELEVRGFDRADMDPDEQFATARKVDEYYEHHHVVRRLYTNLKGRVHDKISQVHDATVMGMLAERERSELDLDVQVTDLIDELEDNMEELPDAPGRDSRPEPQKRYDIETVDDDLGGLDDIGAGIQGGADQLGEPAPAPAATDGGTDE